MAVHSPAMKMPTRPTHQAAKAKKRCPNPRPRRQRLLHFFHGASSASKARALRALPGPGQPKLEVSEPEDALEKEADLVADRIAHIAPSAPAASPRDPPRGAKIQPASLAESMPRGKQEEQGGELQREKIEEEEDDKLQRAALESSVVFRACADCEEEPEGEGEIQREPAVVFRVCAECEEEEVQRAEEEEAAAAAMRDTDKPSTPVLSANFARELRAARSRRGEPLPEDVRGFMEPRFGRSFEGVRVHRDAEAARLAQGARARAFTIGGDIFFGAGEFSPGTAEGRHLLAHELTHVMQQGGTAPAKPNLLLRQAAPSPESQAGGGRECPKVLPDTAFPTCDEVTPKPSGELPEQKAWLANETLNEIRSEPPGLNRTLLSRGRGSRGDAVGLVQQALLSWGCRNKNRNVLPRHGADESFGKETDAAVRKFQCESRLGIDAIVGPNTMRRLDEFVAAAPPLVVPELPEAEPVPAPGPEPPAPGPSKPAPGPAASVEDCSDEHAAGVRKALADADAAVSKTVAAIGNPTEPKVRAALRLYFGESGPDRTNKISLNLLLIKKGLKTATIECENPGSFLQFLCEGNLAFVRPIPAFFGLGAIHVCQPAFHDLAALERMATIVHEGAHRFIDAFDNAYYAVGCSSTSETESLTDGERLRNADSYACLVRTLG